MKFEEEYREFLDGCNYGDSWPTCSASRTASIAVNACSDLENAVERIEKLEADVNWYVQCRELEGNMYDRNFFEPIDQDSLSEVSKSTTVAWAIMKKSIKYKSTFK